MNAKVTKLVNEEFTLPENFSEAVQTTTMRDKLLKFSAPIVSVTNADEADKAGIAAQAAQTYIKEVKEFGMNLRRPLNEASAKIKLVEDTHLAPLLDEKKRLEQMQVDFSLIEQRRVRKEEEERQRQFKIAEEARLEAERIANKTGSKTAEARLEKAEEQWRSAALQPSAVAHKAKGATLKQTLKFEVVNKEVLFKARPDLFTLEIRPSAVNAVCFPKDMNASFAHPDTTTYPGLKVWYEATVSTRRFAKV